jgi:hypothetical protein
MQNPTLPKLTVKTSCFKQVAWPSKPADSAPVCTHVSSAHSTLIRHTTHLCICLHAPTPHSTLEALCQV